MKRALFCCHRERDLLFCFKTKEKENKNKRERERERESKSDVAKKVW